MLNCRIEQDQAEFSGAVHTLVIKNNGSQFWLDPPFLYALQHYGDADLKEQLQNKWGADPQEAEEIPELLCRTELILLKDHSDQS